MSTIMIVAGEPSGDLHAARVAEKLKELSPDLDLFGMGGDSMAKVGVELVYHIRDSAVMGIGEVITAIPAFLKKRKHLTHLIDVKRPDAVVLVDFADFNMRLARFAHRRGIPVIYYIPPKAWAWRSGRAKKIAKTTTVVASIFPFEAAFYRNAGANVKFVGHPLLDFARTDLSCEEARRTLDLREDGPVLGLMPGSRRREVDRLLPVMLAVTHQIRAVLPDCQFVLPLAPSIDPASLPSMPLVKVVTGAVYEAMRASDLMLIASGTATLEAACLDTPMIVVYKMSRLSWRIIKALVKLDLSGLPNVIAGREIVPELLQNAVTAERLTPVALELLQNPKKREAQREELRKVYQQLGSPGAVERTARLVLSHLNRET
ncbi:MAG: lipid-A-disaccharide synthase [Candidatus Poribacteria bacterium]|nr:lipid-A-disaccharide synthase [Candidatus Poribacteria bacterium]